MILLRSDLMLLAKGKPQRIRLRFLLLPVILLVALATGLVAMNSGPVDWSGLFTSYFVLSVLLGFIHCLNFCSFHKKNVKWYRLAADRLSRQVIGSDFDDTKKAGMIRAIILRVSDKRIDTEINRLSRYTSDPGHFITEISRLMRIDSNVVKVFEIAEQLLVLLGDTDTHANVTDSLMTPTVRVYQSALILDQVINGLKCMLGVGISIDQITAGDKDTPDTVPAAESQEDRGTFEFDDGHSCARLAGSGGPLRSGV